MKMNKLGHWSFILGVAIAIVAGLATGLAGFQNEWIATILVILGVVVGFLNISEKEISSFLIAAIALLVAGAAGLGSLPVIGPSILGPILVNIATFVAPAAVIVALKAVYSLGKK